jgi:hypothetical protein
MENCIQGTTLGQMQIRKTSPAGKEVCLSAHEVCRLKQSRHLVRITTLSGKLWITLRGEAQDYILKCGESLVLRPQRLTLVEGLSEARFRITRLS